MSQIIRTTEGNPSDYPAITGLSDLADGLNKAMLWRRIEHHVAYRWGVRNMLWTVEGAGEWLAPLGPAVINSIFIWQGNGWIAATPDATPLGYELDYGTYLFDATVGTDYTDGAPDDVEEAFRRLAEYAAAEDGLPPGVSEYSVNFDGSITERTLRSPNHLAKALVNSGAADLLRSYRRL